MILARAIIASVLLLLLSPHRAYAQEAPAPVAAEDPEKLYRLGLEHLQAGRNREALEALDRSAALLPSPNTDLLRGHALRGLNRRIDAMIAYERVIGDAGARVRAGDARFEPTLADAGTWIALLRPELCEIHLVIKTAGEGLHVEMAGEAITVARSTIGDSAYARLWREPGSFEIVASDKSGRSRTVRASAAASASISVVVDLDPRAKAKRNPAPPPQTWVAWGVGVAGFGVFAVAGVLAQNRMSDLDDCKPFCPTASVDAAERDALVANVGLGIGITGIVLGGALWGFGALVPPKDSGATLSVAVWAPGADAGLSVQGSF